MPLYAQTATHLFAIGTIILQMVLASSMLLRLLTGAWFPEPLLTHLRTLGLRYAALFPIAAVVLSLWYSEVVGLPVCALCWFGRTMMYPLAVMLPIAAWRNDREIWRYVLPITFIGTLITGYQHLLQVGLVTGSICHAFASGGDCAARYVYEFDYVTLPMFGVTVFITTALLVWMARNKVS
jgi:disulfide bond formation protein DsbB